MYGVANQINIGERLKQEIVNRDVLKLEGSPDIPESYLDRCHYDYPDTNGHPRSMWNLKGGSHFGYNTIEVRDGFIIKFCPVDEYAQPLNLGMEITTVENLSNFKFLGNQKCTIRAFREPNILQSMGASVLINKGDNWGWVSLKEINVNPKVVSNDQPTNSQQLTSVSTSNPTQGSGDLKSLLQKLDADDEFN